jgi:hypothetical protein
MTCASNAVMAGRSKPLATPVTNTTARMPTMVVVCVSREMNARTSTAIASEPDVTAMMLRRSRRSAV